MYGLLYAFQNFPAAHENLYSFYRTNTAFVQSTPLLLVFLTSSQLLTYQAETISSNYWVNEQVVDLAVDAPLLRQVNKESFQAIGAIPPPLPE